MQDNRTSRVTKIKAVTGDHSTGYCFTLKINETWAPDCCVCAQMTASSPSVFCCDLIAPTFVVSAGTGHSDRSTSPPLSSRHFHNKRSAGLSGGWLPAQFIGDRGWKVQEGKLPPVRRNNLVSAQPASQSVSPIHSHSPPPPPPPPPPPLHHTFRMGQMNVPLPLPERAAVEERSLLLNTPATVAINETLSGGWSHPLCLNWSEKWLSISWWSSCSSSFAKS